MGACASALKYPNSNRKLRLSLGSKSGKLVIPSPVNGDRSPYRPVTTIRDFGSKDEAFFDSQAWLESDCDDDFLSVNGDFTPSRGNTPVHQSFYMETPQVNIRVPFDDKTPGSKPEPSPTDTKKKLSELFRESLTDNQGVGNPNISSNRNGVVNGKSEAKASMQAPPSRSLGGSPFLSGANSVYSSETTPEKVKPIKSVQCCLPRMLSSRSFSERKKESSPARSIG